MAKKKKRSRRARAKARRAAANPITQGQQAFHRGDYDGAIAAWKQALRDKPSAQVTAALAEVYFRRGLARFHRQEQYAAGLADLDEAARLVAGEARYAYHLGLAHHRQGDLDTALAAYRLALKADPAFVRAAELVVLILLEQRQNPMQTAAWNALPPERQQEFQVLMGLLGDHPPVDATILPPGASACLWRTLAALQSGDSGAREELLPIAQSGDEPSAIRAVAAYALGLDALRRDRRGEALSRWEAAHRLGLDTPTLQDNVRQLAHALAEEAMAAGLWIDAAALADTARSLTSGGRALTELSLAAHFHAGHAEAQAGHWVQALAHWETTRELGENSRELLQNLALAYEKNGRVGPAADLWRQVVRRRPRKASSPDALTQQQVALLWGHVADCYRRAGDVEEAIVTLRNAIKNDADNVDLRLELVDALVADDRWSTADNELKRILKKEPENVGALVRSARSEEAGWRPNRAQPIWRKVLALDPDHLEAQERLTELLEREGYRLMRSGKTDQALARFREALTYTPDEPYLYLACADCYYDQADAKAAREELDRAFALDTGDLDVYHSAVDLCHDQDMPDEAEWVIARAEELAGSRQPRGRLPAEFYLDLAHCCFERDQAEVGDDYVQRAKHAAVGDADGLVDVGLFYLDQDQEGQALTFFDQALRLDPGHGWANYHVGASYAVVAEMREANRHWRLARRTARKTGDQELLEAVESIRSQFQRLLDLVEQGISPADAAEMLVDDDEYW